MCSRAGLGAYRGCERKEVDTFLPIEPGNRRCCSARPYFKPVEHWLDVFASVLQSIDRGRNRDWQSLKFDEVVSEHRKCLGDRVRVTRRCVRDERLESSEPVGGLFGVIAGSVAGAALPLALAAAAGAMLWVVSHELIPASHRPGREAAGTAGLAAGFAVMALLAAAV